MANGTNDAALAQALEKHKMNYVYRGLTAGVLSGMTWGLQGVLMWCFALVVAPYVVEGQGVFLGIILSLVGAAVHDFLASMWILLLDGITGRLKEIPRALRTKPGRLAIFACLFGGPLGMGGYIAGLYIVGATYALAMSAIYPAIGALLGRIVLKERISVRVWIGILACLVGALVIGWAKPDAIDTNALFYLGLALSFCPAIGWGTEGVISCFGMDMIDPDIAIWIREFFSSAIAFFTTLLFVPIIIAAALGGYEEGIAIHWYTGWQTFFQVFTHWDALFWTALAACSGGYSYVFWYRALNMVGTGRAMAFNVTYALWSIPFYMLAAALFPDKVEYVLSSQAIIGAAIITLGAILVVANPKELLKLRDN